MAEAMDVGDEFMESTISSPNMDSMQSIQKGEVLSPEDISWVNSCLFKEPDVWDDNWDSLKGALLEILDFQPESVSSSSLVNDSFRGDTDIEILPSSEGAEKECFPRRALNDLLSISEESERRDIEILPYSEGAEKERFPRRALNDLLSISEESERRDYFPFNDDTNNLKPLTFMGHPFLPGYNDDPKVTESLEFGANMGSSTSELEPSTEDIFRVWDLDVLVEEDELVKQLNKALEESLPQPLPSTFDYSDVWNNLKVDSVDDLIAGIADLSLDQNSS